MELTKTNKYKIAKAARKAEENGDAEWAAALSTHLAVYSTLLLRSERG